MVTSSTFSSAAKLLVPVAVLVAAMGFANRAHAQRDCATKLAETWEITIAGPKEKGDRLVVEGVVTGADGKPVPNAVVYAYQTDADGYYTREKNSNAVRLCGLMKTDERGRYRFHSIKPGSYPGSTIAAHVHFAVSGETFLLEFENDHFLTQQSVERDREEHQDLADTYRGIRPLESREDGSLYCRRDFRVRSQ